VRITTSRRRRSVDDDPQFAHLSDSQIEKPVDYDDDDAAAKASAKEAVSG
jgi:hypothetical protein